MDDEQKFSDLPPVYLTLDPKGRITLPAIYLRAIREFFDPQPDPTASNDPADPSELTVHLTISGEGGIELFLPSDWKQKKAGLVGDVARFKDTDGLRAREARRKLLAACSQTIDRQGRIRLPESLCDYAKISRIAEGAKPSEITVAGIDNTIQIWEKKAFQRFISDDIPVPALAAPATYLVPVTAPVTAPVLPAPSSPESTLRP